MAEVVSNLARTFDFDTMSARITVGVNLESAELNPEDLTVTLTILRLDAVRMDIIKACGTPRMIRPIVEGGVPYVEMIFD